MPRLKEEKPIKYLSEIERHSLLIRVIIEDYPEDKEGILYWFLGLQRTDLRFIWFVHFMRMFWL